MKAIFEPVYNTAGVEQLNKELAKDGGRTVMVSGCIDTQKLHFSSAIASNYNFQLVITSDEGKARDMAEDARFFNGGNVMYYPAKDVIFYNADVQGRQIAGERIRCIAAIIDRLNKSDIVKSGTEKSTEEASDGPLTIVTTIDGISDMLLPVDRFKRAVINLKKGDILDVEDMAKKLTAMGFERFGMVEAKGQFAIRGGIIDIFSYTDETPVYYIRCGESAIAKVALQADEKTEHFGLPVWKPGVPESLIELATEAAYEVEITVPEGTSVTINGIAVPQTDMELCDSALVLDDAAKTYAKQPTALKATVSGLYVAPKVQAYDTQGNILTPVSEPDQSAAKQVYVFEPKEQAAPDPEFVTHMENLMGAYINYMANKDEAVWTNLGVLDQYLVPNGNAYSMLHSIVMDVNWNNPYTARVDRELTISHVKMYADNVCTVEAHYNYQLTKNVVNDYIGTIRWTMVKVGNTWLATNFEQIADGESGTEVPDNLPVPDDEAAAQAERDAAAAAAAEEAAAPAEGAAPADAAAPADQAAPADAAAPAEPVI